MIKVRLFSLFVILLIVSRSTSALASVDCIFVPTVVKQGEYGANEVYLFVCGYEGNDWNCFNLGPGDNTFAKNRQVIATAALLSGKQVRLRFYDETTCTAARDHKTEPNSIWLVK